jgi:hypothetical protein
MWRRAGAAPQVSVRRQKKRGVEFQRKGAEATHDQAGYETILRVLRDVEREHPEWVGCGSRTMIYEEVLKRFRSPQWSKGVPRTEDPTSLQIECGNIRKIKNALQWEKRTKALSSGT